MEQRVKSPGVNGPLDEHYENKNSHNYTDFYTVTYDFFNNNFSGFY